MADINKILNGEAGFSVRDKLNEVIDKVNASAVVVPVGDAPVFDPAKAGGYQAGSIISYRNEASPDTQFQTFAIYVANSDIPVGVSPEDSAEWLFKGVEYTIEGGNTSKNYVNTITALRSVSDMKNGDTMMVGFESRIYEFVESSESGVKPFQEGVGSWMSRKRVSLSNISRVYTYLDAMEGEEIPLPVGNVVISFADSCVFTITDGNGDAQLPVSLSQPSVVTRTGAGFLPSDIEIEPIGGGGGHTILDPAENTMPTQPALQFGAGFTVTDETSKTLVVPSNPDALPNLETAANATQPEINTAVNARLFEQIAFVLSGYDIDVTTDSQDILKSLPYAFKANELKAEFATAPTGSSAIVTFYKNGSSIGTVSISASAFSGTTVLSPAVSFVKGDSLSAVVTQIGMTIPGKTAKAYIQGIKFQ